MKSKVGVMLSGCGVFDGSEIHEAVLTLLYLTRAGAEPICMTPDLDQKQVVNHLTGEAMDETRNVLVEAARIARGRIRNLREVSADALDALIFTGGYGAAWNLCDFATAGPAVKVEPTVARLLGAVHAAGKPLGFMCIAPAVAAGVLGRHGIELTIGREPETAAALEKLGAVHFDHGVEDIHVDAVHKIVSTPAYMYNASLPEVAAGIERLTKQILAMIEVPAGA